MAIVTVIPAFQPPRPTKASTAPLPDLCTESLFTKDFGCCDEETRSAVSVVAGQQQPHLQLLWPHTLHKQLPRSSCHTLHPQKPKTADRIVCPVHTVFEAT
jgi:hypothetical protein